MSQPDTLVCTCFLFAAFLLAGVAQTLWLRSRFSARFAGALDGGRTFRGQRIFGPNKTWRGFVVMVPAVGAAFALLSGLFPSQPDPASAALWPLSVGQYFLLGCWVGFAFMAAELPNSFIKRQLGIEPGQVAAHPVGRTVGFCTDQADSLVGGLIALSAIVPVPGVVWIYTLLLGSAVHWVFNVVLMLLGVKQRAG
jgi:CDP-2,3-bis-(O-geranylgeranyl)-sn-glycerol synthase